VHPCDARRPTAGAGRRRTSGGGEAAGAANSRAHAQSSSRTSRTSISATCLRRRTSGGTRRSGSRWRTWPRARAGCWRRSDRTPRGRWRSSRTRTCSVRSTARSRGTAGAPRAPLDRARGCGCWSGGVSRALVVRCRALWALLPLAAAAPVHSNCGSAALVFLRLRLIERTARRYVPDRRKWENCEVRSLVLAFK
jgi:hypothetical protein